MRSIKVIDVTLRDGGCVNDFNFGQNDMDSILNSLHQSNVDIIELGYINESKGSECGRTQFCDEQAIRNSLLRNKKVGTEYVAMIDYGTFDMEQLNPRTDADIDGIRFAFHKKNAKDIADIGKIVVEKGYKFFIQPMLTMRYTDSELLELIEIVNCFLPNASGFYIVDSFGEMRHNDVIRMLNLVDHNLKKDIPIGFHSHNNIQMSYANAISVLQFPTTRDLFIDSSIMGMGKGAGNLNSELLLEHLNLYYFGNYDISPMLSAIDTVLNRIKYEFYWGYSAEYYLSAVNSCTPTYAQHFYQKHMLPIEQISELLGRISDDKKLSFDKTYADALFHEYTIRDIDDTEDIKELYSILSGKKVLLLAPGKSSDTEKEKIIDFIKNEQIIVISINTTHKQIDSDFIFIANGKRFKNYSEMLTAKDKALLIYTSNIHVKQKENTFLINYSDYICLNKDIESNSGMMALNLLSKLKVSEVILAGFDGMGFKMHKEDAPSDPMAYEYYESLNKAIDTHIHEFGTKIKLSFLTDSLYARDMVKLKAPII